MKLAAYISEKNLTHHEFGVLIKRSQAAVTRYVNGVRIPEPETMILIVQVTDGRVTANDFMRDHVGVSEGGAAA